MSQETLFTYTAPMDSRGLVGISTSPPTGGQTRRHEENSSDIELCTVKYTHHVDMDVETGRISPPLAVRGERNVGHSLKLKDASSGTSISEFVVTAVGLLVFGLLSTAFSGALAWAFGRALTLLIPHFDYVDTEGELYAFVAGCGLVALAGKGWNRRGRELEVLRQDTLSRLYILVLASVFVIPLGFQFAMRPDRRAMLHPLLQCGSDTSAAEDSTVSGIVRPGSLRKRGIMRGMHGQGSLQVPDEEDITATSANCHVLRCPEQS
ncbi:hypothetical protein V8D89_007046 [Ganoderma adspersum]